MAKKKKLMGWLWMVIGVIAMIAFGGLFLNGTFESVFLLKYLPHIVHQVVGWLIIVGGLLGLFVKK